MRVRKAYLLRERDTMGDWNEDRTMRPVKVTRSREVAELWATVKKDNFTIRDYIRIPLV